MKTAIILAAGIGSRFENLLNKIPKGFIEIYGRSLIERSIENLLNNNYEKIRIVTGHGCNFYTEFAKKYKEILPIYNSDYLTSGSGYSLALGLSANINIKSFTILESDLLYDEKILKLISDENLIITSPNTKSDDEVYVEETNGYMSHLSKNKIDLKNYNQELIGITQIDKKSAKILLETINNLKDKKIEYENLYNMISQKNNVNFRLQKTNLKWCEIDNFSHYYRAVNKIYPKL